MRRAGMAFVALLVMVAASDPAYGDTGAEGGKRFGSEIALADLASVTLIVGGEVLGNKLDSPVLGHGLAVSGLIVYLVGGPLIHGIHGDPGGVGSSVVL